MMNDFFGIAGFFLLVILQSLAINGIKICFQEGMIFYGIGVWMKEHIKKQWLLKPVFTCIFCMASIYSAISFFSIVIPLYGFKYIELIIWVWDAFIVCALNAYFYKRL